MRGGQPSEDAPTRVLVKTVAGPRLTVPGELLASLPRRETESFSTV
jgi:hypothetical protein